jgi:hypothetical protein
MRSRWNATWNRIYRIGFVGGAYEIWVASGSPEGEAERHWLTAEKEILATLALVPNASAKRRTGRVVGNRAKARTN